MVTVNGSPRELPPNATVADVVADLLDAAGPRGHGAAGSGGRAGRGMAVAVNGEVVPRTYWAATALTDGDRVEVLTATQGG